jgi:hypothetical protein
VVKFDKEESLSEKLGLLSSVVIINRNESTARLILRIKDDFNLESGSFAVFLEVAYRISQVT